MYKSFMQKLVFQNRVCKDLVSKSGGSSGVHMNLTYRTYNAEP